MYSVISKHNLSMVVFIAMIKNKPNYFKAKEITIVTKILILRFIPVLKHIGW